MQFDESPFTTPVRERKRKRFGGFSRGFRFRTFIVVFKWHHGRDGVKTGLNAPTTEVKYANAMRNDRMFEVSKHGAYRPQKP